MTILKGYEVTCRVKLNKGGLAMKKFKGVGRGAGSEGT